MPEALAQIGSGLVHAAAIIRGGTQVSVAFLQPDIPKQDIAYPLRSFLFSVVLMSAHIYRFLMIGYGLIYNKKDFTKGNIHYSGFASAKLVRAKGE